jgi:hypothetical protein
VSIALEEEVADAVEEGVGLGGLVKGLVGSAGAFEIPKNPDSVVCLLIALTKIYLAV